MSAPRLHLSDREHRQIDHENRKAPARAAGERTEEMLDRIASLEDRLVIATLLLESALELLDRRAKEHARTLELVAAIVRCDEIMAADDGRPRLGLAA